MSEPNLLPLFQSLDTLRLLQPGETLFAKGDAAQSLFVVKSGHLEIWDGDHFLYIVEPGGILGEMALVDSLPRSATAVALEESAVIEVDQRRFLAMIQQTPMFAIMVMRVLTIRLRAMNERL